MFVPLEMNSAKKILCDALETLSRSTWELVQLKKGDYWKHSKISGRVWMKGENRFTIEADSDEEEGFLLGPFLAWVARYANDNLWSANVIFGEVSG